MTGVAKRRQDILKQLRKGPCTNVTNRDRPRGINKQSNTIRGRLMMETKTEGWVKIASLMGKKVRTPDGEGILIACDTPSNGLFVLWNTAKWVVWYGTDNSQNGWSQRVYHTREIRSSDE